MILSSDLQIYVKASDTCNLNCHHCFTSGSRGAKVFFNPKATSLFLHDLVKKNGVNSVRLLYHGGEPMLAPLDDLHEFHNLTKSTIPGVSYGIQTNLVYNLNSAKLGFFENVIGESGIGTSWDSNIRFGSFQPSKAQEQLHLWEKNVRTLTERGHNLTLMVSLSRDIIDNYEPEQIIEYAINLGIKYILFERITANGNFLKNDTILPSNATVDLWILKMYVQTQARQFYKKIGNMFLEEIALAVSQGKHVANRCRGCEQKIITINASGTLSGCPNSATEQNWGSIYDDSSLFLKNKSRIGAMCAEKVRNPHCLTCDVSFICNGDCYKLKWEDDLCAAPKSLMRFLRDNQKTENLKNLTI